MTATIDRQVLAAAERERGGGHGMTTTINRETIIDAFLGLVRAGGWRGTVNLRGVARVLGCAHTNLYNYFPDYSALVWAALDRIVAQLEEALLAGLTDGPDDEATAALLLQRFAGFYLAHPGYFRLIWLDETGGKRPEGNIRAVQTLVDRCAELLARCAGGGLTTARARDILHTIHCYQHGELTIYFAGRGLRRDAHEFAAYVQDRSLLLWRRLAEAGD
ncbi:MAG TPA: TetR/AcrR family transcriptional regulator [bacterium]|nr:TetR/AcrR family transcriptional regulator [bacterium]